MLRCNNCNSKRKLIFIIGGTSYSELHKLRIKYPNSMIVTTNIFGGNSFYESIIKN
uniref:Vacuolar sorting protein n=1 Tax=Moumouvirus sp. 'Monve' TaxID=1128131 RepID=H2ED29_9VIRU|nr:vacuolar sorting protein [Moumouvirus Monve]